MEEWNQFVADSRSIDTMRQIALDTEALGDDWAAFEDYALNTQLTINEVVCSALTNTAGTLGYKPSTPRTSSHPMWSAAR